MKRRFVIFTLPCSGGPPVQDGFAPLGIRIDAPFESLARNAPGHLGRIGRIGKHIKVGIRSLDQGLPAAAPGRGENVPLLRREYFR